MKKLLTFIALIVSATFTLEACATRQIDWRQKHLASIEKYKKHTSISHKVLRGILMTESSGGQVLGIPGRALTRASSTKQAVGSLIIGEYNTHLASPHLWPGSTAGCFTAMQFKSLTVLWLQGIEIVLTGRAKVLASETRAGNIALQEELQNLEYQLSADGLLGDETKQVLLRYLWDFHRFSPPTSDQSVHRLARAARALIIHDQYRDDVRVIRTGPDWAGDLLRKIDPGFKKKHMLDPFTPDHGVALTIAYLEFLKKEAPKGERPETFMIRAYNAGQGNAKADPKAGIRNGYLKKVKRYSR